MKEKTKKEVIEYIKLYEITDPCHERVNVLACNFPEEYNNEQEFIEFQFEIGELINSNLIDE